MSTRNGDIAGAFAKAWAPSQGGTSPAVLDAAFDEGRWGDVRRIPAPTSDVSDPVNHPAHYRRGGLEAIDVIEAFELDYHLGQVAKYILRAGHKDDLVQDLSKARWYLDRAINNAVDQDAA